MDMDFLEHEDVLKSFALYAKRQVELSSIQALGNAVDAVDFGELPILGNPQACEYSEALRGRSLR